jgi:peptidoglycan lytic transglycosylase
VTAHSSPRPLFPLFLLAGIFVVTGCGGSKKPVAISVPAPPPTISEPTEPPTVEPKHAKVLYTEVGLASWYGPPYHNRHAANGEIYDMHEPTAAHRTLPFNTLVRVTNLSNGRSTVVRINDRGPFVAGRVIDLSLTAAKAIDVWRPGIAKVKLEVLETPAPIATGGRWCIQIGEFKDVDEAMSLKERLERRYKTAKIIEFPGPTGDWLRIRVPNDDRQRAEQIASSITTSQGEVWLVRMD